MLVIAIGLVVAATRIAINGSRRHANTVVEFAPTVWHLSGARTISSGIRTSVATALVGSATTQGCYVVQPPDATSLDTRPSGICICAVVAPPTRINSLRGGSRSLVDRAPTWTPVNTLDYENSTTTAVAPPDKAAY